MHFPTNMSASICKGGLKTLNRAEMAEKARKQGSHVRAGDSTARTIIEGDLLPTLLVNELFVRSS